MSKSSLMSALERHKSEEDRLRLAREADPVFIAERAAEEKWRAQIRVDIKEELDAFQAQVAERKAEPIGDAAVDVIFNRNRAIRNFGAVLGRFENALERDPNVLSFYYLYSNFRDYDPRLEDFVEYRAGGIVADSRAALAAALAAKNNLGGDLVALTGTPKQIAWAEKIRARVMTQMPAAEFSKIAKKAAAKFWIDKHK
jgi:hypothetical protein